MLRIGLMLDSYTTPAWIAGIVEQLQQSSYAQISLIILNTPPQSKRPSLRQRLKNH